MSNRGSRTGPMIAISALVLGLWVLGLAVVGWRGLGRDRTKFSDRLSRIFTGRAVQIDAAEAALAEPLHLDDSRLASLRQAADAWKRSGGPTRQVVDQVCLVPDVVAFLEAITVWDERHFFPILIDEPAWTLPFLRAFRPARIVRFAGRGRSLGQHAALLSPRPSPGSAEIWPQALEAVARAWTGPGQTSLALPRADRRLEGFGTTPPGLVLTNAEAPMLAGAVALAAGHFQPLVSLRPPRVAHSESGRSAQPARFGEVLSVAEALRFAGNVEDRIRSMRARYGRLGDDCDFLTIAGDWPYRYSIDSADEPIRGIYALDDLIGRAVDPTVRTGWLNQLRRRWAYAGRLLGDPAASAARAMEALFLQPESALFWNTYGGAKPWSDYSMNHAAALLGQSTLDAGAILHRSGQQADLASWHRLVALNNRFGLMFFNSSGGPDWFNISGGPGRPSDVPRGWPASVATIHSFSAADPSDPQTIAGRWLANGAFNYYGSVNEPFVLAFRPPALVAELVSAGIPLVAALRQGESEAFGFPWRLVYLGDPLYRLERKDAVQPRSTGRVSPTQWQQLAPEYEKWPISDVTARSSHLEEACEFETDNDRLRCCLDAAVGELAGPASKNSHPETGDRPVNLARPLRNADGWRKDLLKIHRDQLGQELRPWFDELLIDALEGAGALEELMTRLMQIPTAERGPRVWQGIETSAMHRLAQLVDEPSKVRTILPVLDLWYRLMGLKWPEGSRFPTHLSERVGTVALQDVSWTRLWLDRLRQADETRGDSPRWSGLSAVIAAERARAKSRVGGLGSSR